MTPNRVGVEGRDTFIDNNSLVDCNGKILLQLGGQERITNIKLDIEKEDGRNIEFHPINKRRPGCYSKFVEDLN